MAVASGQRFASAADTLCLWDPSQLTRPIVKIPCDEGRKYFTSVRWSDNGQHLVAASGSVFVIQTSGADKSTLYVDKEDALCATFVSAARQVLSGHRDTTVKLWNVKNKAVTKTFPDHVSAVTCLCLSPSGTHFLSGSFGGDLVCRSLTSGDASDPMRTPSVESVTDVQFNSFTDLVAASSSQDGDVNIWDIKTQQLRKTFVQQHLGGAKALSFSPVNEKLLASCGMDGKITCYDAVQAIELTSKITDAPLTAVLIMSDGFTIIAGSQTGYLYNYDLRSTSDGLVSKTKAHESIIASLSCWFNFRALGGGHRVGDQSRGSGGDRERVKSRHRKGSTDPRNAQRNVDFSTPALRSHQAATSSGDHVTVQLSDQSRHSKTLKNEFISPLASGTAAPATKPTVSLSSPESLFSPLATSSTVKSSRKHTPLISQTLVTLPTQQISQSTLNVTTANSALAVSKDTQTVISPLQATVISSASPQTSFPVTNSVSSRDIAHPSVQQHPLMVSSEISSVVTQSSLQPPSTLSSLVLSSQGVPSYMSLSRQPLSFTISGGVFSPLEQIGKEGRQANISSRLESVNQEDQLSTIPVHPKPENLTQTVAELHLDPQVQYNESVDGAPSENTLLATTVTCPPISSHFPKHVEQSHPVLTTSNPVTSGGSVPVASLFASPPQYHIQVFQSMIDDSVEELRLAMHRHIREVHVDMIRQFEQSEMRIQAMLERYSINPTLLEEIARLKEENEKLKRNY